MLQSVAFSCHPSLSHHRCVRPVPKPGCVWSQNPCSPKIVPIRCPVSVLPPTFAHMSYLSAYFFVVLHFQPTCCRTMTRSQAVPVHAFSVNPAVFAMQEPGQGSKISNLMLLPLSIFLTQEEGLGNVLFLCNIRLLNTNPSRQLTALRS